MGLFSRQQKKLTSDSVWHAPNPGRGSNTLCLNGSAHAKRVGSMKHDRKRVDCPACRRMLKTGCDAVEAIPAWDEHRKQFEAQS